VSHNTGMQKSSSNRNPAADTGQSAITSCLDAVILGWWGISNPVSRFSGNANVKGIRICLCREL